MSPPMVKMLYGPVDWTGPVPPPPRLPNGGLYTGEPFAPGAPWGNVPIVPDAAAHVAFVAAVQHPAAVGQQVPWSRPGSIVEPQGTPVDKHKYPGMVCLGTQK